MRPRFPCEQGDYSANKTPRCEILISDVRDRLGVIDGGPLIEPCWARIRRFAASPRVGATPFLAPLLRALLRQRRQ
jgi:hypothetical protein